MKKGKKVYNLTIVFDDKTEEIEHLMEELYHDDRSISLAEALDIPELELPDILESECSDAPPDMLREIISDYYLSILDDSDIIGLA
jgi:hypothetical protein